VALRFLIAAAPALVLARPSVSWSMLVAAGLALYAGQFLFQFFGIANGMPVGLASLVVQRRRCSRCSSPRWCCASDRRGNRSRGWRGVRRPRAHRATAGHDLSLLGFGLTLVSPISFGIGNIFLKRIGGTADLALVAWMSLVPPLPALALSMLLDGPGGLVHAVASAPWSGWAAALFLGLVATVFAYAIWATSCVAIPSRP